MPLLSLTTAQEPKSGLLRWISLAWGVVLALALLKFGNPMILDRLVTMPTSLPEWTIQPWPIHLGYILLTITVLLSLPLIRFDALQQPGKWLFALPLTWLAWQFVSATQTTDRALTSVTLPQLTALVACYYIGSLALGSRLALNWFLPPLIGGFVLVLYFGWDQHYGGLEATRKMILSQPGSENLPAEHLKRIKSSRIFSTLLYPNTLAGVILLLLPMVTCGLWAISSRWQRVLRAVVTGLTAYVGLACLVWSGSKAGWLIAILMVLAVLLGSNVPRRWKLGLVCGALALGLGAFFLRYATYFEKGATSVGARFDYWKAACTTAQRFPVLGAGPGTFSLHYRQLKPPEAEMALLTHNDYLEQACDSGLPGAICFTVFVVGVMIRLRPTASGMDLRYAAWLGLLGWSLQGFVEFGLYIPAVAWPAFFLIGWLHGSQPRQTAAPLPRVRTA